MHISEGVFADFMVTGTGKEESLQENVAIWSKMLQEYEMKHNEDKIKVIAVRTFHETNIHRFI